MRKLVTYFLLFSYTTSALMPVLPYVSDTMAHTFWLYQHISTVHYEHGQYHAHYQSLEAAKKADPEKNSGDVKAITTTGEHLMAANNIIPGFILQDLQLQHHSAYSFIIPSSFKLHNYPPPKA